MPAVKQAHDLVITFQLPSLADEYLAKAEDYLSSLIGHEGRGSLLSALKARGWATGLSAGVPEGGYERNTGLYLFDISVTLTEPGLQAGPGIASLQPTSVKRTPSILLELSLTAQEELQSIRRPATTQLHLSVLLTVGSADARRNGTGCRGAALRVFGHAAGEGPAAVGLPGAGRHWRHESTLHRGG